MKAASEAYAKGGYATMSFSQLYDQRALLEFFNGAQPYVQALANLNSFSNIDKASTFSSIEELVIDNIKFKDFLFNDNLFDKDTLNKYFEISAIGRLYNNSRANVLSIANSLFYEFKPETIVRVTQMMGELGVMRSPNAAKIYKQIATRLKAKRISDVFNQAT
jgi:hypothetical protein